MKKYIFPLSLIVVVGVALCWFLLQRQVSGSHVETYTGTVATVSDSTITLKLEDSIEAANLATGDTVEIAIDGETVKPSSSLLVGDKVRFSYIVSAGANYPIQDHQLKQVYSLEVVTD